MEEYLSVAVCRHPRHWPLEKGKIIKTIKKKTGLESKHIENHQCAAGLVFLCCGNNDAVDFSSLASDMICRDSVSAL